MASLPSENNIKDIIVLGIQNDYRRRDSLYDDFYAWPELCDFINHKFSLGSALTAEDAFYEWSHLTVRRSYWHDSSTEERDNMLTSYGINRENFRRDQNARSPELVHQREDSLVEYLRQEQRQGQLPELSQKQVNELADMQQEVHRRLLERQARQAPQDQQAQQAQQEQQEQE